MNPKHENCYVSQMMHGKYVKGEDQLFLYLTVQSLYNLFFSSLYQKEKTVKTIKKVKYWIAFIEFSTKLACLLCVSKTKRLFSLGWNKQWSWRHYFYFTNFFEITGLENLLNKDVVRYAARLKDSFIMEDMCYITRLWSFRHVQKRARAITRPKSVPSTLKVVMSWWVLKVEVEYILYNLLSHKSFGWKIWTTNKYCHGKCFQEIFYEIVT